MAAVEIPNRPAFRAQEVCEIASVQPYVLRGWEAEFPDLGVAKAAGGQRVYRRADVERVLKLKELIQVEGLTLAGARRRLEEEGEPDLLQTVAEAELHAASKVAAVEPAPPRKPPAPAVSVSAAPAANSGIGEDARVHLQEARQGLQWILQTLSAGGHAETEFSLAAGAVKAPGKAKTSRKVAK